jgi:hypothetical protein
MHSRHAVFMEAIKRKRKIRVTFRSESGGAVDACVCGPVYYLSAADDSSAGWYYFWDCAEGGAGKLLRLQTSQIVDMTTREEVFERNELLGDLKTNRPEKPV